MNGLEEATPEDLVSGDREFFLDFREAEPKVHIEVRNLIEKNPEIKERVKPVDKDHLNILNIFIDTVGRANWHRKYDKTNEFLRKYHYLKKENKRVYEYFRLHAIRGYTFPNLFASTYGVDYSHWHDDNLKRISSYAKKAGYITGITSDCCTYSEVEVKCKFLPRLTF
jgi:hypothetical protein